CLTMVWKPFLLCRRLPAEKKTVVRVVDGRYDDRLNGVGLVMTPALGIGFGTTVNCRQVKTTGACSTGSANRSNPNTAFRIGVDGSSIGLPSLAPITGSVIPGVNSPYEILDFRIDPHRKVGVEDTWD